VIISVVIYYYKFGTFSEESKYVINNNKDKMNEVKGRKDYEKNTD